MTITYVETYLGCDIYYVTPPDVSQAIYRSPCVTGDYFKISAVWKRICTGQGGTWDGTSCTLPEPDWEYHSTYRGIEIQVWMPDGTPFTAYFDDKWHQAAYLSTLQAAIDDFLGVGIPTTLTINVPNKVDSGKTFTVYGDLYETETAIRIPGQRININYNGKSLGYGYTGSQGDYFINVSINEGGVWTIKADFSGTPGYSASRSQADAVMAAPLLKTVIKIVAPAAIGLALTIYCLN